jgi:hypothetical protein
MNKTKFLHLRFKRKSLISPMNPHGIDSLGGVTIAYQVWDAVGQIAVGFAACSKKDTFCRKTGRLIAKGRLELQSQPDNRRRKVTRFLVEIDGRPIKDVIHDLVVRIVKDETERFFNNDEALQ